MNNRLNYFDGYLKAHKKYKFDIHEYSLLINYTDKIMENIEIEQDNSDNLMCAIICVVMCMTRELLPKLADLINLFKNDKINDTIIKYYINYIIKTFNFPLPTKTFATYELLIKQYPYVAKLYRMLCGIVLENTCSVGINSDSLFSSIIHEMMKYHYFDIITNKQIMFSTELQHLAIKFPKQNNIIFPTEYEHINDKNGYYSTENF